MRCACRCRHHGGIVTAHQQTHRGAETTPSVAHNRVWSRISCSLRAASTTATSHEVETADLVWQQDRQRGTLLDVSLPSLVRSVEENLRVRSSSSVLLAQRLRNNLGNQHEALRWTPFKEQRTSRFLSRRSSSVSSLTGCASGSAACTSGGGAMAAAARPLTTVRLLSAQPSQLAAKRPTTARRDRCMEKALSLDPLFGGVVLVHC
jgi:hypothetical protein